MMLAAIKADANDQKLLQWAVRKAQDSGHKANSTIVAVRKAQSAKRIPPGRSMYTSMMLFDTVQFFVMVHQLLP
jgi:hypothetical protein